MGWNRDHFDIQRRNARGLGRDVSDGITGVAMVDRRTEIHANRFNLGSVRGVFFAEPISRCTKLECITRLEVID